MTFFFEDHRFTEGKITKTITATAVLARLFGKHAKAQADLSIAIDGRPNTMLMPGLDCSPNGPVWTNFANFRQNFQQASVGLVFRYHFRGKLEENLATLVKILKQQFQCQTMREFFLLGGFVLEM